MSRLRLLPWIVAIVCLALPLANEPSLWPFILAWGVVIVIGWLAGRAILTTRTLRMSAALILLPVLFLFGWWGGWWLIPADLTWLVVEALDGDGR